MLGSLSIASVVLGAFRTVWLNRAAFLRSLALPGSLLVVLFVGGSYGIPGPLWLAFMAFALYAAIFAVYAVIRAGPIRLNSEPGAISGLSAVRKRRIGARCRVMHGRPVRSLATNREPAGGA